MSEEEMMQLATSDLEIRVAKLRSEQRAICRKEAFAIAENQADSIIFQLRINPLKEDLYQPTLPNKPDFIETDSTLLNSKRSVKPIK